MASRDTLQRHLADHSTLSGDLVSQFEVFMRIEFQQPAGHHGQRSSARCQRPAR